MYTCNGCGGDFPYLIFEYNSLVCEKCSIRKNIRNAAEFDAVTVALAGDDPQTEEEEGEEVIVKGEDVKEIFTMIERISHPQIRADFMEMAEQYFEGEFEEE
jgi:hypothetical protein